MEPSKPIKSLHFKSVEWFCLGCILDTRQLANSNDLKIITLRVNRLNRKPSVYEKIQCKRHIMELQVNGKKIRIRNKQINVVKPQHCKFSVTSLFLISVFCISLRFLTRLMLLCCHIQSS